VRSTGLVFLLSISAAAQQPPPVEPRYVAFAERLLAAADDDARHDLLTANHELADSHLADALMDAAAPAFNRRDYEHAIPIYRVCAGVSHAVGSRSMEAKCSYNAGLSLVHLYRVDEALIEYDRARAAFEEVGEPKYALMTLGSAGVAIQSTGQFRAALPYLERAMADAEATHDRAQIAQGAMNLGGLYYEMDRLRDALRLHLRALEIFRDMPGAERRVGMLLNNIGDMYHKQQEFELAFNYHQQAAAVKEKAKAPPEELVTTIDNLAADLADLGRTQEAFPFLDRGLQLSDGPALLKARARLLHNYGYMLKTVKRTAEAAKRFEESAKLASQIGNPELEAEQQIELAEFDLDERRFAAALARVQPGLEYSRDQGNQRTLAPCAELAARALMKLAKLEEAETAATEAIAASEQLRAEMPAERQALARFMTGQALYYQTMVEIQMALRRPALALAWAERAKARVLVDVLRSGGEPVTRSLTAEERKEETARLDEIRRTSEDILALRRQPKPEAGRIAALQRKVEDARLRYRSLEMAIYASHPELKFQRAEFEPVTPEELAAAIPDSETALLEFEFTRAGAYLFAITRSGSGVDVQVYRLPAGQEALARDAKLFRNQIANRDLDFRRLAGSLYRDLLGPALQQLRGKRTLVIVPDGELWQLPFQALETRAGHYLIEDYGVLYTPSLTVLSEMRKLHRSTPGAEPSTRPSLLAVDAAVLPGLRREVDGLRGLYGATHVRVLAGAQADSATLTRDAPNYRILHLAAHGIFDDRHPMDSYLVLASNGKPEAGVLPASQMMGLNLNADMVVLSGCETGRGSVGTGEGLIGMSWALFIAGARATVTSQWKVDAESTADFMLDFHRGMGGLTKVKAIQQAALHTMRNPQYRHPFYWSGFVLMGEGR
jgi:CHAT domain-containing protein/tetratricopeptide (TPR) repeat protein